MNLTERAAGDIDELARRAGEERDALRRDRWRAVLLALSGKEAAQIAQALGRARRSVQDWAYAYRDGGIDAIQPRPRPGRPPKLPRDREAQLRERLDAGPRPQDGVCTLRGKDVVRILEQEFGDKYSLGGAYDLLARLGYSCLSPRPLHEKADPQAIADFQARAPFLSTRRKRRSRRTAARSVSGSWTRHASASRGRSPTSGPAPARVPVRCGRARYDWVYLYTAVEPATGESAALVAPNVNTGTMNAFLKILDRERKADEHFVLIMDQAGWHKSRTLKLPEGITVLLLPPYSPELNPVENLWHYLRSHYLSNRSYEDYDALLAAGTDAYRKLTPEVIKSVCRCPYLKRAE